MGREDADPAHRAGGGSERRVRFYSPCRRFPGRGGTGGAPVLWALVPGTFRAVAWFEGLIGVRLSVYLFQLVAGVGRGSEYVETHAA